MDIYYCRMDVTILTALLRTILTVTTALNTGETVDINYPLKREIFTLNKAVIYYLPRCTYNLLEHVNKQKIQVHLKSKMLFRIFLPIATKYVFLMLALPMKDIFLTSRCVFSTCTRHLHMDLIYHITNQI